MTRTWTFVLAIAAGLYCADAAARERLMAQPEPDHTPRGGALAEPGTPAVSDWTYLGPERADVSQFAISPTEVDRMLAVNSPSSGLPVAGRLLQTHSAGLDWVVLDQFRNSQVKVAFTSDGIGLAATEDRLYASIGGSWMHHADPNIWQPFAASHLSSAPFAGAPVWMTGVSGGVFRVYRMESLDDNWVDVTPTLPAGAEVRGLAASDTTLGQAVLAWYDPSQGLLRTMYTLDNGASWTTSPVAAGGMATVNVLRMVGDRILVGTGSYGGFNGLVVGDGLGASWSAAYEGGTNAAVRDIAVDVLAPDRWWIATPTGVKLSLDGGQTWQAGASELMNRPATVVHHDAAQGQLWVGAQGDGMWLGDEDGDQFEYRSYGLNTLAVASLAIDGTDPGRVAALHPAGLAQAVSVSMSDDGGLSWDWEHGPASSMAARVRFDDAGTAYVGGEQNNPGLYRRTPGGAWQSIGPPSVGSILDVNFGEAGTLVISEREYNWGTDRYDVRLHRYDDTDGVWEVVLEGIPDSEGFRQIERVPTPDGVRMLAREDGLPGVSNSRLMASDDDGRSWYSLEPLAGNWSGSAMCVGVDGVVMKLVQVFQPRIYRSADGGQHWERTDWQPTPEQGMGGPMTAIHCPGDGRHVYLGDRRGNVWASSDWGDSFPQAVADASVWHQRRIDDIRGSRVGLYVAHGGGVWVNTSLAELPAVPEELEVSVSIARMRTLATLEWVGGASQVDIRRNGTVVATVPNRGRHVDAQLTPLRAPVTSWQVCNAGTDSCSETVQP